VATVGGGNNNVASGLSSVVAGGFRNVASGSQCVVGGGGLNEAGQEGCTVAGGYNNIARILGATIGGGRENQVILFGNYGTIGGGENNYLSRNWATLAGGKQNTNNGLYGTISGGAHNRVNGDWAVVSGGVSNVAAAMNATVPGGSRNTATNNGSFVWGDGSSATASWADNTFTIRAIGGTRFYTAAGTATGVRLAAGGNAWASVSDREAKQDFQAVDKRGILKKVADLPVTSWTYKADLSRRYIGPMAQDFHSTFGLGDDDKSITTLDTDGVLLASVQGLVEELQERDRVMAWERLQNASALAERDGEIEDLRKSFRDLKAKVDSLAPPKK